MTDNYLTLLKRHQTMQAQLDDEPGALATETILQFLDDARAAGAAMRDVRQREQMRAILRHWGGIIYDRTGDYPAIQLVPFEGELIPQPPHEEVESTERPARRFRSTVAVIGILLFAILLIMLLTLLGPQVGDIFTEISSELNGDNVTAVPLTPSPTRTATPPPPVTPTREDGGQANDDGDDTDNDGLDDEIEFELGTNPFAEDSDGDGLWDIEELEEWGSDPLAFDTDGDGLLDGEEVEVGTDPLVADSDGDGLLDGVDSDPGRPSTPTFTPSPTATPLPPTATPTPQTVIPHSVQAGETLADIAKAYDVSQEQIVAANDLSLQDRLEVGQLLFIPLDTGFIVPEVVIKIPVVNLRSGPGIEYTIIGFPERGTFATVLGQTVDPTWYLVELEDERGTRGWLSAAVVRLLYPTRPETIPLVATVPPTPSP